MNRLHVSLLGKFHMQLGEHVLTGLNTTKVRDLLCYLLLYRDRPHQREVLANLLWDEQATNQPQRCLRKNLSTLRTALDTECAQLSDDLLLVESDWMQINPAIDMWLDITIFEQAFADVRDVPGREIAPHAVETLKSAVDLYRGDLLEGVYHDWAIYERERFQQMYLAMLSKLMESCEAHQDYKAGIDYGTRILYYDRAHERTHRHLMRLYYLDDNRTAALRQYEHCIAALDSELGVKPTRRTRTLYQQIHQDQLGALVTAVNQDKALPDLAASLLPDVLNRLKQLQAALVEMQNQVRQDIQTVDCLVNAHC